MGSVRSVVHLPIPGASARGVRSVTSARSSVADASSIWWAAAPVSFESASLAAALSPDETVSASRVRAVRTVTGRDNDDSHCFAAADRSFESVEEIENGGSIDDAIRAPTRHAIATSRSPPIGARPAHAARARKRKRGVAREKRGCCPITLSNLGIHLTPGYIHKSHGTAREIHPLGGRRR